MKTRLSYLGLLAKLCLKPLLAVCTGLAVLEFALFQYYTTTSNAPVSYAIFFDILSNRLFLWLFSFALIIFTAMLTYLLSWKSPAQPHYTLQRLRLSSLSQVYLRWLFNIFMMMAFWAFQALLVLSMFWLYQHHVPSLSIDSINFARGIYHNAFLNHIFPINNQLIVVHQLVMTTAISLMIALYQLKTNDRMYMLLLALMQYTAIVATTTELSATSAHYLYIAIYLGALTFQLYRLYKGPSHEI